MTIIENEEEHIEQNNAYVRLFCALHRKVYNLKTLLSEIYKLLHHSCGETEYRGIVAKNQIRATKVFLRLPEYLLITTDTVWKTNDLKKAICLNSGLLQPFDALCLFLMCEKLKGLNSEWSPFINVLPTSYSNPVILPHLTKHFDLFPPKIVEALKDQLAEIERVKRRVEKVFSCWLNDFSYLIPDFSDSIWTCIDFDEDLFLWAWASVNTRCIYKDNVINQNFNNIEGDTITMVPFLDMINHASDSKINPQYSKKTKCFELELLCGIIPEGAEIFISYGSHSNSKLFVEYGFILDDNPNNVIAFDVDDIYFILKDYLTKSGQAITDKHWNCLRKSNFNCFVYAVQNEPSFNFMSVFRLLTLQANELERCYFKVYEIEDEVDENSDVIDMAKYFLNSYSLQLEKLKPLAKDLAVLPAYAQKCIAQIWNEDISIIAQCLTQF